jgi:hypothetical protein
VAGVSVGRLALQGSALLLGVVRSGPAADPAGYSSTHAAVGIAVHRIDAQSVREVRELGIRHIRYTLYWSLWQSSDYRRKWEEDLRRGLSAGFEPLVVVHSPPFGNFQQRERVYLAFSRFMAARAAQFPQVHAWQLWNEMDVAFTDVFGAGHDDVSLRERGRLYGEMLRLAYPAIKHGNPHALVVVGGIASDVEAGFLDGLYDSRAEYDVLAIHTYGFPLLLQFQRRGEETRRIMARHHDRRPVWNTEFGQERAVIPDHQQLTDAQTESEQLRAWRSVVEANDRQHLYDRMYGYVLAEGQDLGFGLVRQDGSVRPAYLWLRNWLHHR